MESQWLEKAILFVTGGGLTAVGNWLVNYRKSKAESRQALLREENEARQILTGERELYLKAIKELTQDLRAEIKRQDEKIKDLEKSIEDRDTLISNQRQEIDQLKQRVEHLEEENKRLKNEN